MKVFRSIRWQLQIWHILLLGSVLVVLFSWHYHLRKQELIAQTDATLQNALLVSMPVLAPMLRRAPPGERSRPGGASMGNQPMRQSPQGGLPRPDSPNKVGQRYLAELATKGIYIYVWNGAGETIHRYGLAGIEIDPSVYTGSSGEQRFVTLNKNRELVLHHHDGLLLVVGRPLSQLDQVLAPTRRNLIVVGLSIFIVGIFGGWVIVGRALTPIGEISATAEQIAQGKHARIELSDAPSELASLAHTLNASFNHLDDAIETQVRFSADASHELRTPIAVVIAQAQAALKRERTAEEYQAVLNACLRAGQRMKTLANSLLDLTRINGTATYLKKGWNTLDVTVSDAVDAAILLSDQHAVSFHGLEHPLLLNIDKERIHQVITNLLSNAIKHNPDGCAIRVSMEQTTDTVVIKVSDDGIGIPADALPHIFDRFYRVDKSRSREQGGSGLGLAIVKSLIEAHAGTIDASSIPGEGATFTIQLPTM